MAKAHVYLLPGANVEATDTFASWVDTTNQLVYDMGTVVLTTTSNPQPNTSVGGYTVGNAHVQGIMSANTIVATDGLRGGSTSASGNLIISSNTIFGESTLVQIGSNTNNFTVNANNSLFTGNVAINSSKTFTVNASNTQFQTGSVYMKTNTEFTGNRVDIDAGVLDVTSPTTFTTTSTYFNVDTISLGANNLDSLVVNAASDFNSSVNFNGTINATANATFNGAQHYIQSTNTIIGNATTDRLNVTAYLSSDLIPASTTVDLGTDTLPYGNVHTTYVWADSDVESLGEFVLKGTTTKTIRTTGSNGSYQNLNLTFSNNSVSNTSVVANTSGLFGGVNQLYSLGSSSVNWKELYVQNSFVTGNEVVSGDLSVNGGDITTSASTFNLLDANATTVNAFGAATAIDIGATSGTITINNPTVVGTQTTQNLWNTTALTVNAFGAATAVTLGATTGTMTLRNPTIVGSNTTQALFNTVATTVNAFGAATAVNVGATTGTVTINNPTVVGSQATVNLWNTASTTVNAFGAATALNLGNALAGQTVTIGGSSTGASTYNLGTGVTANTVTKTVNVGTGGALGSTTNVNLGSVNGGATTINSAIVNGAASSVNLWNTGATTVNAFGAATALNLGAATGNTTINNNMIVTGDLEVDGGDITTSATSFNVLTSPTTVNAFTSASALSLGGSTGNTTINNNVIVTGDLDVDGGDITTSATTFNIVDSVATTVNAFGAATSITLGAATGLATIRNADVRLTGGTLSTSATTFNLLNTTATTANVLGAATAITLGATTGTATLRNATVSLSGNTLSTSNTTIDVFNTTATTANVLGAATAITLGAATGTTTVRNDLVVSGDTAVNGGDLTTTSTTFNLVETNATTVNAFGTATTLNVGGTASTMNIGKIGGNTILNVRGNGAAGTATITSNVTSGKFAIAPSITTGTVEVGSTASGRTSILFNTSSSSTSTGALVVAGGVGIGKNLNVANNVSIAGNLTVDGEVVFTNSNNVTLSISTGNINNLTVYDTLTFDTATISSTLTPTANVTHDIGTSLLNWNNIYVKEAYIANTVSAATGSITSVTSQNVRVSSGGADAVELAASTFGSSSRKVTIKTPNSPLTANGSLTLANGDTVLQPGTMAVTGTGLGQFASTTSAQLAGVISDDTGTGALVFGTAPTITNASLVTPTIGGAGATYSGSTSGSTVLRASATAGTTTITMPAATGTMALTSDVKDATITISPGTGMTGGGTFTTNQSTNGTITINNNDRGSSQNIFKNIAVTGQSTVVADNNDDTLTLAADGIVSITTNTTTDTITFTATETDTLATVTARGATTSNTIIMTNTTDSTATNNGALVVSGGVGIAKGLNVGGDVRVFGTMNTADMIVSGNLTVTGNTTILNTTELTVDDINIIIGDVATPSNTTADGGGITLKGTTNKTIIWDNLNSNWTSSENWNIASGKTFKINNTSVLSAIALGPSVTGSSLTSVGTLTSGTWNATVIGATFGGTGISSYTVGDLLFANGTTTLGKLADVAAGNALISGGVGVAPAWGKIGLTTHVTGVLPVANGGTGQSSYVNGELLIGNTTGNTLSKATLTPGQNVTISNGAGSITINAASTNLTAAHSATAVTLASSTGASTTINAANTTSAGVITTTAQSMSGVKTFTDSIVVGSNALVANSTAITAGSGVVFSGNGSSLTNLTAANITGIVSGANGGTGVNNSGKTITLGGNLTTSGSFNITLTALGTTSVTLPSSGTIATVSGVETLENKTLTAPKIANGGFIADANGNEQITFTTAASAVNHLRVINAATGNMPVIISDGADTNIGLVINTKGTGTLILDTGTSAGDVQIKSGTGSFAIFDTNSSHAVRFVLGDKTANTNLTIPTAGDVTLVAGTMVPTTGTGATGNWSISAASVQNSVTFNNAGTGDNSGTTFNGSVARTISYNTIGAPSTTGTNASGTWNISILGNAATATSATSASTATTLAGLTSTVAELNFVDGVTSNVQTQLNGKAPVSNPIFTGEIEAPRIYLTSTSDANTTNSVSAIQVGPSTGINLVIDNNEVMVRNNNVPGLLILNGEGGQVTIGGNTSTTSSISLRAATVSASGDIVADGNVTAYSDARLKENVRTINGALDKVSQMRGVYFDKDGKAGTGVIAQEIEKVLPEVVLTGEEYKSVAYGNIVGVLIEAIKELKAEIEELKRDR